MVQAHSSFQKFGYWTAITVDFCHSYTYNDVDSQYVYMLGSVTNGTALASPGIYLLILVCLTQMLSMQAVAAPVASLGCTATGVR